MPAWRQLVPGDRTVVLAPGAAYGRAKQWPPRRFSELATLVLAAKRGVALVGSRADRHTCAEIVASVKARGADARGLVDLSGRTSLGELAALMARADAVVSNDSGAMHLAGAVGTPVVAVFGATNEQRTSPLTSGSDATPPAIVATDVWCRPCMLRECPIDHRCMKGITPERVYDSVERLRTA